MLNKYQHIYLFATLIFFFSCNLFKKKEAENRAIAKVNDTYLLMDDIADIVPINASKEDSLLVTNNYIQKWIREQLVLDKAELNLNEENRNFEKQIDDYRKTLTIYSYENQLMSEILDTNVTDAEINSFYQDNNAIFVLKNDIVKVRYLKVLKSAPSIKKITKVFSSNKPEDLIKLKELAHQYAEKFHLNSDEWVFLSEIEKELPKSINLNDEYLKHNRSIIENDSLAVYFVRFIDYKLANEISPLSFERENIKSMIINKRKLTLITQVKKDLYEQALNNNEFEIYDKPIKNN